MASEIDFSSLTLNSDEARETSQLVFETLYAKPEIAEVHDIQTGVDMDRYIPIMGQLGLVGKTSAGDCSRNDESAIPTSQKQWTPKLIEWSLIHCQDEVPTLLKFWKKSMIAANTWEEIPDEMVGFITDRAIDASMESILRITSFGDTDASNVGSGSGSETITAGVDADYFTPINGLWKQVFTDQAGSAEIYRHEISENAEASKSAQLALGSTTAIDAMRATYENIDPRAFENGELVFQMTRTLYNNYLAYLEDKSLAFTLQRAEDGKIDEGSYRGIRIKVRKDWDRNIKAYHDLGSTYYLPHRLILTKLTNIPIGTSDEESLNRFDSYYDRRDRKHYMDAAYKLDLKILLEDEIAVAY